jgi:hypothetical protein
MSEANPLPRNERPKEVETACGSRVLLNSNTPWVVYRDEVVYFCMPECKLTYEKDPLNSCMAGRILASRR